MTIPVFNDDQVIQKLHTLKNPFFTEYYAYYSSWFGGILKNPAMMLLPIDDHMVHRGDGVFETIKAKGRKIYLLDEHLERLMRSAETLRLVPPFNLKEMKEIILETLKVANQSDVLIRIYLSRGPGNFSVNPYDSVGAQFYIVITALHFPALEKYEQGIVIGKSLIPVKESWLAQVKSCNYLPNVMMKQEAIDRGLEFVVAIDEKGFVAEGATENIIIVDKDQNIVHPEFGYILKGTTMTRACELARENRMKTLSKQFTLEDLQSAREIMLTGTTLDILPVVEFEGLKIGDGKPGPIAKKLRALISEDISTGSKITNF